MEIEKEKELKNLLEKKIKEHFAEVAKDSIEVVGFYGIAKVEIEVGFDLIDKEA